MLQAEPVVAQQYQYQVVSLSALLQNQHRRFSLAGMPWLSLLVVYLQGLSAFSRLTALETFSITDVALNNDALTGITACSQIQDLTLIIKDDPDTHITLGGLLHLAQLTRLTSLLVRAVIDNTDIEVDLVSSNILVI